MLIRNATIEDLYIISDVETVFPCRRGSNNGGIFSEIKVLRESLLAYV